MSTRPRAEAEYRLHCFAQSGNSYKVALMLELAGADWTPVFVDFFGGATRTPEYRALNAMGEAPVLEHRGTVLSQSGVILDYLCETLGRFGPPGEGAAREAHRREILRWLLWDNHKLTSYTATYRFLRCFAGQGDSPQAQWLHGRMTAAMKVLDAHLAARPFAVADAPTVADLSMVGYLYFADEIGVDLAAGFPNVAAWTARIAALPGWRHPYELMPGHPLPARAG